MEHPRVPALVVSGYLGSGKTTLVRRLLREAQQAGERVAVVSNEFGELGIDRQLLGFEGESYVELEGGCVCCRLSDELVETLEMLWARVRPDRVIVETSGVALPYDVQLNFWRDPIARWAGEALAVVVVNAEQLASGRDLDATFEQQVSSADLLLLNKLDLVGEGERSRLEERLRGLEPDAPILGSVRCDIESEALFPPDPGASRRCAGEPRPHSHESFATEEIAVQAGASEDALVARLQALGALRVKGFVLTDRGPRLVQGVGARIELETVEEVPPELLGRVVVIRRG